MTPTLDRIVVRYVGYALLFLSGAYLLYLVRGALPVFLLAGFFAYALEPVLKLLEGRGYSRAGAVGFVFLVFLLLFMLFLAFLASAFQQAQAFNANLGPYLEYFSHGQERAEAAIRHSRLPASMKDTLVGAVQESVQNGSQRLKDFVGSAVAIVFNSMGSALLYTIVLPIVTYWCMLEMNTIRGRVLMCVPPAQREDVIEIAGSINELLGRYVRGQMIVCGLFGLLCTISFSILGMVYGMQYGLVLGVVAGLIYIVPYIGMSSLAIAAGLTAYLTSSSPVLCASLAVGSCVLFNLVIDYGISPRVLGQGIGLHPLLVIFALVAGAKAGGPLAMILAVPVMASLRVVLIYLFPQLTVPLPQNPPESSDADPSNDAAQISEQLSDAETKAQESVVAA